MQEEIRKQEEALRNAMLQADIPQLEKLMHEKLIFHIPRGVRISKEMDLDNYCSGKMKLMKLEFLDQQFALHEHTAVVSTRLEMAGDFAGEEFSGIFLFLRVWSKVAHGWQVIAGGSSPLSS